MAEKTPRTRTFNFSLCGPIFKTKEKSKSTTTMKGSTGINKVLSKFGNGSKASPEQDESGPSDPTSSTTENPFADNPHKTLVLGMIVKYVTSSSYFPSPNPATRGRISDFDLLNRNFMVPTKIIRNDKHVDEFCSDEISKEKADTSVSRSQDPIRWGNTSGLSMLENFSKFEAKLNTLGDQNKSLSDRVGALETENKTLKSTIDRQDAEIERQGVEIRELKETSPIGIKIRNRFFAGYLRNSRNDLYDEDHNQKSIKDDGNEAAHGGEPVIDARLFKERIRSDDDTYMELYGLGYAEVLKIRKSPPNSDP